MYNLVYIESENYSDYYSTNSIAVSENIEKLKAYVSTMHTENELSPKWHTTEDLSYIDIDDDDDNLSKQYKIMEITVI